MDGLPTTTYEGVTHNYTPSFQKYFDALDIPEDAQTTAVAVTAPSESWWTAFRTKASRRVAHSIAYCLMRIFYQIEASLTRILGDGGDRHASINVHEVNAGPNTPYWHLLWNVIVEAYIQSIRLHFSCSDPRADETTSNRHRIIRGNPDIALEHVCENATLHAVLCVNPPLVPSSAGLGPDIRAARAYLRETAVTRGPSSPIHFIVVLTLRNGRAHTGSELLFPLLRQDGWRVAHMDLVEGTASGEAAPGATGCHNIDTWLCVFMFVHDTPATVVPQ